MKFLSLCELSQKQQNNVAGLIQICNTQEPTHLSFPLSNEDNFDRTLDCFYLCYDEDVLVSALGLRIPHFTSCECIAYTHPAYRKQGLFSDLWEQALYDLEKFKEMDFLFLTDHKSKDTKLAFDSLDVQYWYSELIMEYKTLSSPSYITLCSIVVVQIDPSLYQAFLNKQCIGSCGVATYTAYTYLYDLEISEAFRGYGYGTAFMKTLLVKVAQNQIGSIRLQVSSQNQIAYHLYSKLGFQVIDKLSYYLA